MSAIVVTRDGPVTSRRIVTTTRSGRDIWSWRTDGTEPLLFDSVTEADAWLAAVADGGTRKERDELAGYWHVEAS